MSFDFSSYDFGDGGGYGTVDVISAPDPIDSYAGGTIAPLSPADEAAYQQQLAQADAQALAQAPTIQAIEQQLPNFQDILPADLTSQIQSMSQQLLQQQSVIQQDVQTTLAQQTTVNQAATAYQQIYASASPQVTAATSDYNSSLAGYNQAYAQYAKSHNPNYLGSVLGQLQRDIPNVSAGWFLNKMNADKATITNLNNQITAASTAYANDLAAYKATAANLQSSVSSYNATYANYTGAVATAQGDVAAAQQAAQAKAAADAKAASDKAAADKAAADAKAASDKANTTVTTIGTGNATVGGATGNATIGSTTGNTTVGGNATVSTGGGAGGNVTIAGTSGNGTGTGGGTGGILPGGGNGTITSGGSNVAVTTPTTTGNTSPIITTVPEANVTVTATGPDNAASNTANTTTDTASTLPPSRTPTGMPSSISSTTPLGSALLGSALSSQPEPAVAGGDPYILGTDEARKNVWNQESLRNALGI